jgi:hypothetical protein
MGMDRPGLIAALLATGLACSGLAATAAALAAEPGPDETVTFNGLQWALQTNGSDIRWPDAIDYCANLALAGHNDWRLPTMAELESLYDPDSADGHGVRSPIIIDTCCLWSDESLVDRPAEDGDDTAGPPDRYHWGFMFDGGLEYYAVHIFEDGQALCVRDAD